MTKRKRLEFQGVTKIVEKNTVINNELSNIFPNDVKEVIVSYRSGRIWKRTKTLNCIQIRYVQYDRIDLYCLYPLSTPEWPIVIKEIYDIKNSSKRRTSRFPSIEFSENE